MYTAIRTQKFNNKLQKQKIKENPYWQE